MRVSASGGDVTAVTQLDPGSGSTSHRLPVFLLDGRHFLYFALGITAAKGNVFIGSLDSTRTQRLLGSDSGVVFAPPGFILFTRERSLRAQRFDTKSRRLEGEPVTLADNVQINFSTAIPNVSAAENMVSYVAGASTSVSRLVWVDATGKEISAAVPDAREYFDPRLSPDGKLLVVTVVPAGGQSDLWIHDLARQVPTRLTFDPANEFAPVWSPDGRRIVYTNFAAGPGDLYLTLANGTGAPEVLLKNLRYKVASSWSRDGQFLWYHAIEPKTRWDIYYYSFAEKKSYPFVASQFSEQNAQPSPDGRFVAYVSDESGRNEIYVRPFPPSDGKWQISSGGGSFPSWSPDGRKLFFVSWDQKLMAAPIEPGSTFAAGVPQPLFAATTRSLMGSGGLTIRGTTGLTRNQYAVAPDGKRFLLNQLATSELAPPSVTLVQNWTEKLRK